MAGQQTIAFPKTLPFNNATQLEELSGLNARQVEALSKMNTTLQ